MKIIIPKYQAENLYIDFYGLIRYTPEIGNIAKKCALLAVDTILEANPTIINCDGSELNYAYWINVKKEIEKL
jgi:hypothetical protein